MTPNRLSKRQAGAYFFFYWCIHSFSVLSCYYLGSHLTFVASAAGWRSSRLSNSPDHPTFCFRDDETLFLLPLGIHLNVMASCYWWDRWTIKSYTHHHPHSARIINHWTCQHERVVGDDDGPLLCLYHQWIFQCGSIQGVSGGRDIIERGETGFDWMLFCLTPIWARANCISELDLSWERWKTAGSARWRREKRKSTNQATRRNGPIHCWRSAEERGVLWEVADDRLYRGLDSFN